MQKRQETDALHNPIVAYSIILSTHLKLQNSNRTISISIFFLQEAQKKQRLCRCFSDLIGTCYAA